MFRFQGQIKSVFVNSSFKLTNTSLLQMMIHSLPRRMEFSFFWFVTMNKCGNPYKALAKENNLDIFQTATLVSNKVTRYIKCFRKEIFGISDFRCSLGFVPVERMSE